MGNRLRRGCRGARGVLADRGLLRCWGGVAVAGMTREQLRERLAAIEHDQWMAWARNLRATELLSYERLQRWAYLIVPYDELPEDRKEDDRLWADKVLAAIDKWERGEGGEDADRAFVG